MESKTTGKRIVTKGAYARVQINKYWGWVQTASSFLLCIAILFVIIQDTEHNFGLSHIIRELLLVVFAVSLYHVAVCQLKRTLAIKPVVPLTRANTGSLPTSDSLVRASEEPMQAQKAALLRAAAATQEMPPDQLVRAVNGQE